MTTSDARKRNAERKATMTDTEREYITVRSLVDLESGDFLVHPVIGGWKVCRNWQASYEAQVRADERKKIAEAILTEGRDANDYGTVAGIAWVSGWQQATLAAARIARSGGAS